MTTSVHIIRRVHPRARRLKLSFKSGQFVLTIPPRCAESSIQAFLSQTTQWCQTQLDQYEAHQSAVDDQIYLPCLQQTWHQQGEHWICAHSGQTFQFANISAQQAWLLTQARAYLPQRLMQLAQQHGFVYLACRVSRLKTRWGSCTAKRQIHLNASLMFLSVEQIDYVLLHELCHTRQMNHSTAFWQEVARVCPDFARIRGSLKLVKLPTWWMNELS